MTVVTLAPVPMKPEPVPIAALVATLRDLPAVARGVHVGRVVGRGHQRGARDAEAAQARKEQVSDM